MTSLAVVAAGGDVTLLLSVGDACGTRLLRVREDAREDFEPRLRRRCLRALLPLRLCLPDFGFLPLRPAVVSTAELRCFLLLVRLSGRLLSCCLGDGVANTFERLTAAAE